MVGRRHFLIAAVALLFGPRTGRARQAGKLLRIGRLSPISSSTDVHVFDGFRQALRGLGWVEDRDVVFEYRFANGDLDRLPTLAAELVHLNVDVIVTGSTPGALAAKNATRTIPIVIVTTGDPVRGGLVSSLARPGGNLTGVTALAEAGSGKRLELIMEAVPGATRVGALVSASSPYAAPFLIEVKGAARELGAQLHVLEVRDPSEFEQAFAAMARAGDQVVMVGTDPLFNTHRRRLVEVAARNRLPTMYGLREFVDVGGLMFYGASLPRMYRYAATFVDKILKGSNPADLPLEQPTQFELVINLTTAKALKLTISPSLLLRAELVIE